MSDLDLRAIAERYHHALEAKPSKGPITDRGIAAIIDSVCDVPDLLGDLDAATRKLDRARALTEATDSPGWVRAGDLLDALEV